MSSPDSCCCTCPDKSCRLPCGTLSLKSVLALIGGFMVHLSLGTIYTWGNINPYATSYIRMHSHPTNLTYSSTVWVFALMVCGQGLAFTLGGLIERRLGSRLATMIGGSISSVAVLLSYFTIKWSYYGFLATYGVMFGVGVGIAYGPPLNIAMKWFPNHKGAANGFIVAGFGGGAFIFDQVQTAFLNPHNLPALNSTMLNTTQDLGEGKYFNQEEILSNVPNMMLILAGSYLSLQIIGVCLMFSPPDFKSEMPKDTSRTPLLPDSDSSSRDAVDDVLAASNASPITITNQHELTPLQVIRTRPFITLWLMFFLNQIVITFISTLYKTYGQSEVVNDDHFLAILGAFAAVFNSVGRIVWGRMADKFSFKAAAVTMCAGLTVLMGSLYITHLLADQAGRPLLFIWICLIFLFFSGSFSLFPTATAKTFGQKNVTVNYGLLFTSGAVSGPLGALLSTTLTATLHSYGIFILCSALSLISMILGLSFNGRQSDGRVI